MFPAALHSLVFSSAAVVELRRLRSSRKGRKAILSSGLSKASIERAERADPTGRRRNPRKGPCHAVQFDKQIRIWQTPRQPSPASQPAQPAQPVLAYFSKIAQAPPAHGKIRPRWRIPRKCSNHRKCDISANCVHFASFRIPLGVLLGNTTITGTTAFRRNTSFPTNTTVSDIFDHCPPLLGTFPFASFGLPAVCYS